MAARILLIGAALLLSACGQETDRHKIPAPAAFSPDRFQDLPIPSGFVPNANEPQLAVSYAGGRIRRYHSVFRQVTGDQEMGPEAALAWYRRRLRGSGWELEEERFWNQRWRRERGDGRHEILRVEAGRKDKRTIIRLVLDADSSEQASRRP